MSKTVLSQREKRILAAFIRVHLPRGGPYELGGEDVDIIPKIDAILATLHPINRTAIRAILRFFNLSPLFFLKGLTFTRMSDEKKLRYLKGCGSSRIFLRRSQLFVPRFFVNMFYYADPRVEKAIGYYRHCPNAAAESAKEA